MSVYFTLTPANIVCITLFLRSHPAAMLLVLNPSFFLMSVALVQHAIFPISKPQLTVQSALHSDGVQLAVGYFVSAQKDHVSNTIDKTLKCLKFSE